MTAFKDQHQYYCVWCKTTVAADRLEQLCVFVNEHNFHKHPSDWAEWSPAGLACSMQYTGPDDRYESLKPPDPTFGQSHSAIILRARPEYLEPRGTKWGSEWGTALKPPEITTDDLAMLWTNHIKW